MKTSQVALSVLGTIAVAGYLVATEWPFWERWTKADKPTRSKSVARSKAKQSTEAEKPDQDRSSEQTSGTDDTGPDDTGTDEPTASPKRTGHVAYWVDAACDCQDSYNMLLETVELTPQHTILTILNANRREAAARPPGDKDAQFLLEWRYVNNNRPRHDITELREIATHPDSNAPLHFQLVFPRISDQVARFQVSGHATTDLDYFKYASVKLTDEMTLEELERYDDYRRCGFDGATAIPKGQRKTFQAHDGPGRSGFSWSVSSGLSIKGSSSKEEVTVRAKSAGQGEVCLESRVDGKSCRSCQPVEVASSSAPALDFRMKTCGGIPSKDPHWQFEIVEPVEGASYQWQVSKGAILRDSDTKRTLMMRAAYRPEKFTVTLNATIGGEKHSYEREFHTIYSCLDPD